MIAMPSHDAREAFVVDGHVRVKGHGLQAEPGPAGLGGLAGSLFLFRRFLTGSLAPLEELGDDRGPTIDDDVRLMEVEDPSTNGSSESSARRLALHGIAEDDSHGPEGRALGTEGCSHTLAQVTEGDGGLDELEILALLSDGQRVLDVRQVCFEDEERFAGGSFNEPVLSQRQFLVCVWVAVLPVLDVPEEGQLTVIGMFPNHELDAVGVLKNWENVSAMPAPERDRGTQGKYWG